MGSRPTSFATFVRSCVYAALAVVAALAFVSTAKAADLSRYCQTTDYSPMPCAYFEEGVGSSGIDAGDGETWGDASFTLDATTLSEDGKILNLAAHLNDQTVLAKKSMKIDSFNLAVQNYEPSCMAWDEYVSHRRPEEKAELIFTMNGIKAKTSFTCSFSREYQASSYDFKPGVRALSCWTKSLPQEFETPKVLRWFYRFQFILPSTNTTTKNPCYGEPPPPPERGTWP